MGELSFKETLKHNNINIINIFYKLECENVKKIHNKISDVQQLSLITYQSSSPGSGSELKAFMDCKSKIQGRQNVNVLTVFADSVLYNRKSYSMDPMLRKQDSRRHDDELRGISYCAKFLLSSHKNESSLLCKSRAEF